MSERLGFEIPQVAINPTQLYQDEDEGSLLLHMPHFPDRARSNRRGSL